MTVGSNIAISRFEKMEYLKPFVFNEDAIEKLSASSARFIGIYSDRVLGLINNKRSVIT